MVPGNNLNQCSPKPIVKPLDKNMRRIKGQRGSNIDVALEYSISRVMYFAYQKLCVFKLSFAL